MQQLLRVDRPDQRQAQRRKHEHLRLVLDYPEVVAVVVLVLHGLDHELHDGAGEEHAECVLEGEREVLVGDVVVLFELGEVLENFGHDQLVVDYDAQPGGPAD